MLPSPSLQAWVGLGPQGSDGEKGVKEGMCELVARPGPLPSSVHSVKD